MFGLLGASVELVRVRASTYGAHNRTAVLLLVDRETGPDLTWQWTLPLWQSSCAPRSRVSFKKKRKYEIEFNPEHPSGGGSESD